MRAAEPVRAALIDLLLQHNILTSKLSRLWLRCEQVFLTAVLLVTCLQMHKFLQYISFIWDAQHTELVQATMQLGLPEMLNLQKPYTPISLPMTYNCFYILNSTHGYTTDKHLCNGTFLCCHRYLYP